MTILSSKIIFQRMLEGLKETEYIDKIIKEFSPNSEVNNEELARIILDADDGKKQKFFEDFKIEIIPEIAKELNSLQMDEKCKRSNNNKLPILYDSFDIKGFQSANYDLRLGDEFFVSREKYPKRLSETNPYIVIEPGDFAILTTHEYIYVPDDLLGLISLRNRYKKSGLINISGFHVDPGYYGKLMFSVYNAGPEKVLLKCKEPVFMIMYDKLEEPALKGYGKEGFKNITVDLVSGLIGFSISPIRLKRRIESLETHLKLIEGIVIALFVALIIFFIKFLTDNGIVK